MNRYKRLLALLLSIAMLISLLGCQSQEEPSSPTTEPTETTEPPVTEPAELTAYRDALAAVNAAESLSMRISATKTTAIAGATFTQESSQTLLCSGLGTDSPRYESSESVHYTGDYSVNYDEIYTDGVLYLTVDSAYCYSGAYTPEDMVMWYLPAILVDPNLYGDIAVEGSVLTFSQPNAAESWALPADAEFIDASGTASLSAGGELQKTTYTVTYAYGSAEITLDAEVYVTIEPVTIDAPADTGAFIPLQSLEAVYLTEQSVGLLSQAKIITMTTTESLLSQAAGYMQNQSKTINSYRSSIYAAKIDSGYYAYDATGESYEYNLVETFKNGTYTYEEDGGEPVAVDGINASIVESLCDEARYENIMAYTYWQDAAATDLGSLYLIELTLNETFGTDIEDSVSYNLWSDKDFLDGYASAYANNELTAYIGIDKFTGLPTSAGYYYEGVHTIDGYDYILSLQVDQSFAAPSLSAYKEITGEMAPEAKPEEAATPLFYHVTGPEGQEMWLFGTIHVGDNRTAYLPQEIYDALLSSDALAIECDTETFYEESEEDEELQEAISDAYYYSDGTTIQDHIDAELYETALMYMKATGNYNMNADYMKPYVWYNSIDNFYLRQGQELTSDQGVEERLTKLAEENGIPLLEVESTLFQIQMTTGFSEDLQILLLEESIAYSGQSNWEGTMELYEMWCAGDEAVLREQLSDEDSEEPDTSELTEEELAEYEQYKPLLDEYNQAMSYDRNDGMLEVLTGYLESGDTVFVAVGLAHLLNNVNGLVDALRDAGYTVELVQYS